MLPQSNLDSLTWHSRPLTRWGWVSCSVLSHSVLILLAHASQSVVTMSALQPWGLIFELRMACKSEQGWNLTKVKYTKRRFWLQLPSWHLAAFIGNFVPSDKTRKKKRVQPFLRIIFWSPWTFKAMYACTLYGHNSRPTSWWSNI